MHDAKELDRLQKLIIISTHYMRVLIFYFFILGDMNEYTSFTRSSNY